jgi:hypothetical protein
VIADARSNSAHSCINLYPIVQMREAVNIPVNQING